MPISKLAAPLDGVLGGFRRGGRGDDVGAGAWPGLVQIDGVGDDATTTALGARSGTAKAKSAFLNIPCMKSIELREDGTGIERR